MGDKTVYILGAGFSNGAGAPLQSDIIREIFSLTPIDLQEKEYCSRFFNYRNELKCLLSEIFFINEDQFPNFSLEDIYSTMDRCLLDNLSLKKLSKIDLIELRNKINALIIMLIDYKLNDSYPEYIEKFSRYLITKKKEYFDKSEESDPFSIISTNWDIVIEKGLEAELRLDRFAVQYAGGKNKIGFLDYCFYVHSYDENRRSEQLRSGQYWRGKGHYNVKVLKLHGSINWLQCQRCQRVFITPYESIALKSIISDPFCEFCSEKLKDDIAKLSNILIMPTFLKDLSIYQLKLSWQIAGVELHEASKLVFMGYSFPMADFEFRQLLARTVKHDTVIDVVLRKTDDPKNFPEEHPIQTTLPTFRYTSFFGKRKISFFYEGVECYINQFCKLF
jgi:hypothetical protein